VHGTVKLGLLKSKPAEDPAMVQMATSGLVRNSLFLASEVIKKSVTSFRISFSLDKVPFNGCRFFTKRAWVNRSERLQGEPLIGEALTSQTPAGVHLM